MPLGMPGDLPPALMAFTLLPLSLVHYGPAINSSLLPVYEQPLATPLQLTILGTSTHLLKMKQHVPAIKLRWTTSWALVQQIEKPWCSLANWMVSQPLG
jgi:hypothetical protein